MSTEGQAAAISNIGMHDVIPEPQAFSVPFMFDSEKEADCTFDRIKPRLDEALAKRGLLPLHWSKVGSIYLFCDQPRKTPAEAKSAKVWAWEGDPKSVEAYRAAGVQPVVLSATDMLPSLQTGMIDCVPNVPLYVLTARLFDRANHMMDAAWSYLIGATIVRKDAWERIDPALRPKLQAIAVELGKKVDAEVKRLNTDAVAAMQKQGLKVVPTDPAPWRAAMQKTWPIIRGGVVPAEFFDHVKAARDACRKR